LARTAVQLELSRYRTRSPRPSRLPRVGTRGCALGADAGQKLVGGLVGRIRRDELAAEGALEDRAAEGGRAALCPLDRGAERVDRRELLLDARDDPNVTNRPAGNSRCVLRPETFQPVWMNRIDVRAWPTNRTTNPAQVAYKPCRLFSRAEVAGREHEGSHAMLHKGGKLVLPVPQTSILREHDPAAPAGYLEPLRVRHAFRDGTEHLELGVHDDAERTERRGDDCRPEAAIDVNLKLLV
jgi:hypothetical protein